MYTNMNVREAQLKARPLVLVAGSGYMPFTSELIGYYADMLLEGFSICSLP